MKHALWAATAATALMLLAAGCGGGGSSSDEAASGPATVTEVKGTDLSQVELTEQAAERLDIRTAAVEQKGALKIVPYSAVLYSPTGETWVYVSSKPLTFVRHRIVVERIDGERVVLRAGPAPGAKVATVGVAELFGAESGLGQ